MKFMLIGQEEQSKGEYLHFGPYEDINMAFEGSIHHGSWKMKGI